MLNRSMRRDNLRRTSSSGGPKTTQQKWLNYREKTSDTWDCSLMATPYNTGPLDNPLTLVIVRVERVFCDRCWVTSSFCNQGNFANRINETFLLRFTGVVNDEKSCASSEIDPVPSAESRVMWDSWIIYSRAARTYAEDECSWDPADSNAFGWSPEAPRCWDDPPVAVIADDSVYPVRSVP